MLDALRDHDPCVIAMGASAGAVEALGQLLPHIPASLRAAILVVVHIPPDRRSALPDLLARNSTLAIMEAEDKLPMRAGSVYFAPPNYHLLLEPSGELSLSADDAVHFSRPSIDVLFDSVAYACRRRSLGILLSGGSADGAAGLSSIRAQGGLTWVQQPSSARMATMPEAALALAPHPVLEPREMADILTEWTRHDV